MAATQPPLVVRQLPTQFDIDFVAGDDLTVNLTVKVNGIAQPWAGVTFTQAILTESETAVTGNPAFTIVTPQSGKITLSLSAATTTALGQSRYIWWLAANINSKQRTLYSGRLRSILRSTVR